MERSVLIVVVFLVLFSLFGVYFVLYAIDTLSSVSITGHAVNDSGIVRLYIGDDGIINISSPTNKTYYFSMLDSYFIDLNVSADFTVRAVDGWNYSLYDMTNEVYTESSTLFTPNSSITAVRLGNILTVSAKQDDGPWWTANVTFYVNVSNTAPIFGNISDPILACEGQKIAYDFNATDADNDALTGDISPKNPFYLNSLGMSGLNMSLFRIVSGTLAKEDVGNYAETISVMDPYDFVDSYVANISVIEINNPPEFDNDLGARTVWLQGENSTFYYQVDVTDVEDGVTSDGDLVFNLTWGSGEDLFDIDGTTGVMNYSPVVGHEGKVYSLTVCVADNALDNVHEDISYCSPRDGDNESACDSFTLTVTDENRAPQIINYTPINATFSVSSTASSSFFVEVYDADGTIPDIDWYVDGILKEHGENMSNDSFSYSFGCGVSGAHYFDIVTSDGLLSDSHRWNVNVVLVACPVIVGGGVGGGGGGGYVSCWENWVCDDWNVCQNAKRSFDAKMLSLEDYVSTKEKCVQNGYNDERFCGFQITSCFDLNNCSYSTPLSPKPPERRMCYFTEDPSCYDGITNCHDGACELLVDCGGPCGACATCSDGKQNQGESGIDCGGPCPFACELEEPFSMISNLLIALSVLLALLILYIIYKVVKLLKEEKEQKV